MADQITNYQCPACSGSMHFSGTSGKVECDYCGSAYTVEEMDEFYAEKNKNAENAKKEADANGPSDEWSVSSETWTADGMTMYKCPACGAELVCEETMGASKCPYCDSPAIVPGQFSDMLKPDYVIPFKLQKEDALKALKNHYGNRFLLPQNFKDANHLEEVKGVYVPFWLYDGVASGNASYKAYTEKIETRGDEKITTKKIYHVERGGSAKFEKIPADASTKMDDALMDSIEPYDYKDLKDFSKAYIVGYMADKYDVTVEEDADRALSRARETMKQTLRDDVKNYDHVSTTFDNIKVSQGKASYALMPVWLLNTKWNGNNYVFAMNGQTGKMVGDLPINKGKLIGTTLITFIIAAILMLLILGGDSVLFPLFLAAVIAAIVAMVLASGMKSVNNATKADHYISKDSIKINHRVDQYVRTETTKEKIEKK